MENHRLDLKEMLKNKAFAKMKPDLETIENFKINLGRLLDQISETESEEFHKNLVADFLKQTYYTPNYFINTKGRNDLVIYNGKDAKSSVGVILETKKPTKTNNTEMPKVNNLNKKAFQQLILYFLRERITHNNLEIKYLIVTNIYEWFIFDAKIFEKLFVHHNELIQNFKSFEEKQLSGDKTDFFYKEIAKPAIASVMDQIKFTHFDLRGYKVLLKTADKKGNQELEDLYKFFSPNHLLKLPFANDSNSLNKPFYNELLHIIGLTETKEGAKKVIGRKKEGDRNSGSLIENAISRLDSLDKIAQLRKPEEFGENDSEKLFNVALRLAITWINRVLFLKLLEAQLIKYHRGDQAFSFLNLTKVKNYDDLNSLFFDVLAREQNQRDATVKDIFANVPYLNSSLFELTDIEQQTIVISNLRNERLPIFGATVLADSQGKRRSGELNALEYLFAFLDAYDFSSDGSEDDQEDSEKLINASVLGLIFEKINGYKDGSFYTPSFITMYMCRETIRRAIVQKFNEVKGWDCKNLDQLYEKIVDKKEANRIINSLKICDPAVGSGHFLVSALNEIIAIKSELKVLLDRSGKSLKDYRVEVRNDKLLVYDDEGKLFEYHPNNAEKQRVQEALFHEKQTIIEGCLFGVDINPNSVIICRLRLWIELLKNAYYRADGNLETLPNIDINIKCGNSLISRFSLDLNMVSGKSQTMIEDYRQAVRDYQNAKDKGQKRTIEKLIREIKDSFLTTLNGQDTNKTKLRNLEGELYGLENQVLLFEESAKEKKAREKKINKLNNEIDKLRAEIEDIESGKIYENALEWRFEFPEVLNNQGDFIGFDVVIGNPPYGNLFDTFQKSYITNNYFYTDYQLDIYSIFFELAEKILSQSSKLSFIIPNTWLLNLKTPNIRKLLFSKFNIETIRLYQEKIFEEAVVDIVIFIGRKNSNTDRIDVFNIEIITRNNEVLINNFDQVDLLSNYKEPINIYESEYAKNIKKKFNVLQTLGNISNITQGTKPFQKGKGKPPQDQIILDDKPFVKEYKKDGSFRPLLRGSLINKYSILWNNNYYISFGEWLAEPRYSANYDSAKKIVIRQTSNSLIATLDKHQFIVRDNLYVITSKDSNYPEEIILGLLNSYLLNWYYQNIINNEVGEALAQVKRGHLAILPIPKVNLNLFSKLIKVVDKILTAKKSDPKADTTALEKAIDQLVYQLYGLTEEEIKIVEGGK
ncbi:MAG: TaqI-like C-terminal specificity domain-containing protein [Snowella sp.]|nr:TaqI-like C-terminal specificity domain-containing protein [Snowella sp.]